MPNSDDDNFDADEDALDEAVETETSVSFETTLAPSSVAIGGISQRHPAFIEVYSRQTALAHPRAHQLLSPPEQIGTCAIGRDAGPNSIRLSSKDGGSRHHATILVDGETCILENHGRHGTRVNGAEQTRVVLDDGDVVRMGKTLFIFRLMPTSTSSVDIEGFLGVSPASDAVRDELALLATSDAWILLRGETGTGKEVCARALHSGSKRTGPFVAVNCATLPKDLAESQLFGHLKGAFTGAEQKADGFFHRADHGTLFLDELGELDLNVQAKLLRALETREVTRMGATRGDPIDLRVVTATHAPLEDKIAAGTFREDLYARISDVTVHLPPLRDRREDILLLLADRMERKPMQATLAERILLHQWPMNVREVVKCAKELLLKAAPDDSYQLSHIEHRLRSPSTSHTSPAVGGATPLPPLATFDDNSEVTKSPETEAGRSGVASATAAKKVPPPTRAELLQALSDHGGKISPVSEKFGRSRRQVHRWIEHHGIDLEALRS